MDAVGFHQLSPRLQQIAARLIEDEAFCNLTYAEHPNPTEYTYELWPGNERIRTIFLDGMIVDDEHEEEAAYDPNDYGEAESIRSYKEAEAWKEEHRLLNRGYNY